MVARSFTSLKNKTYYVTPLPKFSMTPVIGIILRWPPRFLIHDIYALYNPLALSGEEFVSEYDGMHSPLLIRSQLTLS